MFDTLIVFLNNFLKKLILKKFNRRQDDEKHEKLPSMQRVKGVAISLFMCVAENCFSSFLNQGG